jgi:hypothetical protein
MRLLLLHALVALLSMSSMFPRFSYAQNEPEDVVRFTPEELKKLTDRGVQLISWARANAVVEIDDVRLATWLAAQEPLNKGLITSRMQNWILSLHVTGTPSLGERISEEGTGFFLHTTKQERQDAMTALHVLRSDDAFLSENGIPQRQIGYNYLGERGQPAEIAHDKSIRRMQSTDAAVFYTDGSDHEGMRLSTRVLPHGEPLLVLAWPINENSIKPIEATFDRYETAGAAKLLRLSGSFVESESGSPVIGHDGLVVGILTERGLGPGLSHYGLAVPVSELGDLGGIGHLGRSDADDGACHNAINGVLQDRKTVTVRQEMTCPADGSRELSLEVPRGYQAPGKPYLVAVKSGQRFVGLPVQQGSNEGNTVLTATVSCELFDNDSSVLADGVSFEVSVQKPLTESEKRLIGRFCSAGGAR